MNRTPDHENHPTTERAHAADRPPGGADSYHAALTTLERHGHKNTVPRRAIVAALARAEGALTVADLAARLRAADTPVGIVTIYRTLELLVAEGLACRLSAETGELARHEGAYTFCDAALDGDAGHHHHLICTGCGRVEHLTACALAPAAAQALAHATGYTIERHTLLLFGRCPACQERLPAAAPERA